VIQTTRGVLHSFPANNRHPTSVCECCAAAELCKQEHSFWSFHQPAFSTPLERSWAADSDMAMITIAPDQQFDGTQEGERFFQFATQLRLMLRQFLGSKKPHLSKLDISELETFVLMMLPDRSDAWQMWQHLRGSVLSEIDQSRKGWFVRAEFPAPTMQILMLRKGSLISDLMAVADRVVKHYLGNIEKAATAQNRLMAAPGTPALKDYWESEMVGYKLQGKDPPPKELLLMQFSDQAMYVGSQQVRRAEAVLELLPGSHACRVWSSRAQGAQGVLRHEGSTALEPGKSVAAWASELGAQVRAVCSTYRTWTQDICWMSLLAAFLRVRFGRKAQGLGA